MNTAIAFHKNGRATGLDTISNEYSVPFILALLTNNSLPSA